MLLFLENLWNLFVDMSFYMVIGLVFTGVLHAFVEKEIILKHIGKNNTTSVVKASIFGVPLPLCSCGVVPTALELRQNGASRGAVISFLTSTPQTGVDSIIATYGLMGALFAVFRAVAAFLSGIIAGIATNIFCKETKEAETSCCCNDHEQKVETSCCCCSHEEKEEKHSCYGLDDDLITNISLSKRILSIFTYSFGGFLDEIAGRFVVGLIVAGLITTLIPNEWLSSITNPFLSMFLMLAIGIPMYICSTASIPIALSLILKGISPGAAFVFLFAGPVTNIASLAILSKTLEKKVLAVYLTSVALCSIGFGLLLDFIISVTNYTGFSDIIANSYSHSIPVYKIIVAVIFGLLVLKSLFKRFKKNRT